jgi:hypothetical protein
MRCFTSDLPALLLLTPFEDQRIIAAGCRYVAYSPLSTLSIMAYFGDGKLEVTIRSGTDQNIAFFDVHLFLLFLGFNLIYRLMTEMQILPVILSAADRWEKPKIVADLVNGSLRRSLRFTPYQERRIYGWGKSESIL